MERFMSVFQKFFLSVFVCANLSACIDLEEELSNNDSSEAQAFKQQLIANDWKSDDAASNGQLVSNRLSFSSNNLVSKTRFIRTPDGTRSQVSSTAYYSIGNQLMLPSGLMAFELNFTNKSNSFDPAHISQSPSTPIELELVIIKDDILYFGLPNIIETCEGEYFEREIVDLSGSTIRDIYTTCYARPTSINFDIPFRKVVSE